MKGTEKQIKCAENIKSEIVSNLYLGSKAFTTNFIDNILTSFAEAAWWIENQAFLRDELVNGKPEQQAKAANKIFAEAAEINPELKKFRK